MQSLKVYQSFVDIAKQLTCMKGACCANKHFFFGNEGNINLCNKKSTIRQKDMPRKSNHPIKLWGRRKAVAIAIHKWCKRVGRQGRANNFKIT